MAENSSIEWTKHTWSPWRGCTKVSDGCKHCYAEALSHRNPLVLGEWGPTGNRVINADWKKPRTWNLKAHKLGEQHRVFPSMCDPFEDRKDLDVIRGAFLELIEDTPQLDWLLLTKRPESFRPTLERVYVNHASRGGHLAEQWLNGDPPKNVWLGVSCENQEWADKRIPILAEIPAAIRFVSYEPALGPIDFTKHFEDPNRPDWAIVGGESGHGARRFDVEWARSTVRQCREYGVNPFVKQLGYIPVTKNPATESRLGSFAPTGKDGYYGLCLIADTKGGQWDEWPDGLDDIKVREFPGD